jgi:hypothetical protein
LLNGLLSAKSMVFLALCVKDHMLTRKDLLLSGYLVLTPALQMGLKGTYSRL